METLEETKKWLKEQEKSGNIKYFDEISNMTLPNDGEFPDYEKLTQNMNNNFESFICKVDEAFKNK